MTTGYGNGGREHRPISRCDACRRMEEFFSWRHFSTILYGLVYLITIGSLIGFVSYAWLLRHAPVSLVATYAYVNPLVAILLGSALAQESLTPRILIAAGVIVGSVILVNSSKKAADIQIEETAGAVAE